MLEAKTNNEISWYYLERYYLTVIMASDAVALSILLNKYLGIKLAVSKVLEPGAPKIKNIQKKKKSQKKN